MLTDEVQRTFLKMCNYIAILHCLKVFLKLEIISNVVPLPIWPS